MYGREVWLPRARFRIEGLIYGLECTLAWPRFKARLFLDFTSQRLRVLNYDGSDTSALAGQLEYLAKANGLSKIIWLVRAEERAVLLHHSYREEAFFPNFFTGHDAWYLSRFLDPSRGISHRLAEEDQLLTILVQRERKGHRPFLPLHLTMREAVEDDIPALCRFYREIFKTYPSPVTEERYVKEKMGQTAFFQVVYHESRLVGAASAEIDWAHANAEITDCATRPEFRGLGLIRTQIQALEVKLAGYNLRNAFSLARATSTGMNAALSGLGYTYQGRLLNNCHIDGGFEDMNLWVKRLRPQ